MNSWSVLHHSLVTDHQSPAEEKARVRQGDANRGRGMRQRQGRVNSLSIFVMPQIARPKFLVHEDAGPTVCSTAKIIGL